MINQLGVESQKNRVESLIGAVLGKDEAVWCTNSFIFLLSITDQEGNRHIAPMITIIRPPVEHGGGSRTPPPVGGPPASCWFL